MQYSVLKKEYKKVVQKKKQRYLLSVRQKLENMLSSNPADYWIFFKGLSQKEQTAEIINLDKFNTFFHESESPPVHKMLLILIYNLWRPSGTLT